MPQYEFEHSLTPSLLDRLLDDRPGERKEGVTERLQNLAQLKASVVRDLQTLLNTRCLEEVPDDFLETKASIATFGLPDMTQFNCKSYDDQEIVRRAIEEAVLRFEPRLRRVRVTFEPVTETSSMLRFRMDVNLEVPPISQHIVFDASLDFSSRRYKVEDNV